MILYIIKKITLRHPYNYIELPVRPLVDCINAIPSLQTIASCQGHWYGKPPYVYFKGPARVAALIERQLREDAMSDHPKLVSNWCVNGQFDDAYEQAYMLNAPNYDRSSESTIQAIWLFGLRRRRLNIELLTLANMVEQAMRSYIREYAKPEIRDCTCHDKYSACIY